MDNYATEGLELLDVGVAIFDTDTQLVFANKAFRAMRRYPDDVCCTGVTFEALVRFNAERGDFGPGDPAALTAERLAEIIQSDKRDVEREMADGQILAIKYRRTGPGGLVVTFEDRTAERRAQAKLTLSEERHALVTRASSDGIYDWNVTDDVLFVSDTLIRLLDFDFDLKASGMWAERVHAEDYDQYVAAIRAHFRGETEALECEYRVRGASGGYRWIQDRGIGVRGKNGKVTRMVGAVRDITEIREARAEIERTEALLMSSLATISDGILLVDAEQRVQLWNDRYFEIFSEAAGGVDLTQIIVKDRPFRDMIHDGYNLGMFKLHPDGVDAWVDARMQAWAKPTSQWELELANGAWILLNERDTPEGGRVSVYTDITEFKRREGEALVARQRFEDAIEAISSGFALWDADDRMVVCNSKYREYFPDLADMVTPGTLFGDIIKAGIDRGLFPKAAGDPDGYLAAITAKRASANGDAREQYMAGGLWLQISDHRTAAGGIVSIYTDITELKRAEQVAHDSEVRLRGILENSPIGVAVIRDTDNVILFHNARFPEVLRGPGENLVGVASSRFWTDLDERARAREAFERDGRVVNREVKYRGMDGSDVWSLSTYERANWEGEPARLIWLFDITEEKANREALVVARDAAEAALADLQRAQVRLVQAEKMASLGQLTAGIAHEIKNPLNFVNNFANLSDELLGELADILDEPIKALDAETRDDAEDLLQTIRENLTKINEHGRRADSIVKNMLLHSREGPSERQSVDLNPIASEALNLAYHGARAENPNFNIEIVKSLAEDVGAVECFPQDLMRVFLNLITNGIYAANKRRAADGADFAPTIWLTTRATGDQIEIEVRDNGTGIPVDLVEKIFMPFFTTKPAGEGTGLGLSLSYDIVVKQHGGELTVESRPGEFTAFRVTLPRTMPASLGERK